MKKLFRVYKSWPSSALYRFAMANLTLLLWTQQPNYAQDQKSTFFESKIRPVLVNNCFECHSSNSKSIKGGLQLDTKTGLAKGGDGGAVVVAGKPEESPLFLAIRYQGDTENMPPKGKLADSVINDFKTWILDGGHDPRSDSIPPPQNLTRTGWEKTFNKRLDWWSFQPIQKAQPPESHYQNPVDKFISDRLKSNQLQLSAEADRETLLRRLYFDLLGLPPTELEMESFLNDRSPEAYTNLVDRLLNSPHYGERMARRWMDLTHSTETVGSEQDALIPYSWAFRDYLIRAFNQDLPYNQLLQEHLAGDLMQPARRDPATGLAQSPVGTSWMRFVEYYHSPVDVKNEEVSVIDNQVDTFGKTFLGLTIACARCHNHKFDPIGTDDFYKLYGTLRTARATVHSLADPNAIKPKVAIADAKKQLLKKQLEASWAHALPKLSRTIADAIVPGKPMDPNLAKFFQAAAASPQKWAYPMAMAHQAMAAKTDVHTACTKAVQAVAEQGLASWKRPGNKQTLLADFSNPGRFPKGWTLNSSYVPEFSRPGSFRVGSKPEQVVEVIRPSGFYSDSISDKLGTTLRSPEFKLTGGTFSVLVSGTSNARLRLVVDNFQGVDILFGGVTPLLNNPRLTWLKLPVRDIWKGQQAYLELVTRDEMPSTTVIRDLNQLPRDGRSGVGIKYVVHHETNDKVNEDSAALTAPAWIGELSPAAIAFQLAKSIHEAVLAFGFDQLTDTQAALLQDLIDHQLLPNSTTAGSQLSQAIQTFRAAEEEIDLSARSVGVAENAKSELTQQVFIRGDHKHLGPATPPGALQLFGPKTMSGSNASLSRLQLAESLTHSDNPIVARVIANRIWSWYFGQGLFTTVDNVGHMGEPPSHPELLDWLALQFQSDGWSIKKMTRLLVSSQAYRQQSLGSKQAHQVDPTNRLLSHASLKRLDAESLRDAILTASGRLDRTLYGLPLPTPQPPGLTDDKKPVSGPVDGLGRRSLYLNVRKNFPVEFLEIFDRPRPTLTVGKRNVSNQPAQSLALMNDPFVKGEAERLGQLLAANATMDETAKMKSIYRRILGRLPTENEIQRAKSYLKAGNQWSDLAQALFETKEFLYLD